MKHALLACLWVATGIAGVGCAGDPGDPPASVAMELGTGEWQFEPLADGQEVTLVHGAQGLWHVWTSFRTPGAMQPQDVRLTLETRAEDAPDDAWEQSRVVIQMKALDGVVEFLGWPAVMSRPECLDGKIVHIRATLEDPSGTSGTDERAVLVRWDPPVELRRACE